MMKRRFTAMILWFCCWTSIDAATVYRYQDDKGRWHFTDRKPRYQHDTVEVAPAEAKGLQPHLRFHQQGEAQQLMAFNPLYAPVQFQLFQQERELANWVVDPRSEIPALLNGAPIEKWKNDYEYRVRLGKPLAAGDAQPLLPPVPSTGKYLITQGFSGASSHSEEPNKYAVDITMPVGESVHAARDGTVVTVKDDYHMGGTDPYFLDKANRVEVLHSDGTFAIYAHILLGSAVVKEGQRVSAGDPLAGAGSSGYSNGPHLHFGLRANDGTRTVSLPFKFKQGQHIAEPQAKQWLRNH